MKLQRYSVTPTLFISFPSQSTPKTPPLGYDSFTRSTPIQRQGNNIHLKRSVKIIAKQMNYRLFVHGFNNSPVLKKPQDGIPLLAQAQQVIQGDLHASFLKNIELLIAQGLLVIKDSNQYETLLKLHQEFYKDMQDQNRTLQKKQLKEMLELIESTFDTNDELLQKKTLLYVGDEIADRGASDFLNLLIWEKIRECNPDTLKFVFSNHAWVGLALYLNPNSNVPSKAVSMSQTFQLLDTDKLKPRLKELYQSHYQSYQLISYDATHHNITMHAPMSSGIEARWREELAETMKQQHGLTPEKLKQPLSKWDIEEYTTFIEEMNQATQKVIRHKLGVETSKKPKQIENLESLVKDTVSNRHLKCGSFGFGSTSEIGLYHPSLKHYTHGHTSGNDIAGYFDVEGLSIHNLDNNVRKAYEEDFNYMKSSSYYAPILIF